MKNLLRWLRQIPAPKMVLAMVLGVAGVAQAQVPAGRPATSPTAELAPDGTPFLIRLPASQAAPATDPLPVLRQQLSLGAGDELRPLRTETDALGVVHQRFKQYYRGVKVEHGEYSAHSRNGRLEALSGEVKRPAASLRVQPALGEAAALARALAAVGASRYKWQDAAEEAWLRQQTGDPQATYRPKGELVLVGDFRQPEASRPLVLAWKFNVYAQAPVSRDLLYVDARTGAVVLRDAIIKHLNAPGTLDTRYSGTRTSTTDAFAGGYRLRETTRGKGVTTLNCHRGTSFAAATDFVDNDNNWTAAEYNNAAFDNAALDAHTGAQATQDYWVTQHGRDSYDNRGTVLQSFVHYNVGLENAFWDGTEMVYGDGATRFRPLTSVDVCAHEIGHAVCATTARLIYQNESGAINEGLSDIWGAAVENHYDPTKQTWLIGEDIDRTQPSLRSMSNPNAEGQPDTYLGTNWQIGGSDNGGVHKNSGVLNFWFYLLSVGGTGTNDFGTTYAVTGITIGQAARIVYRAEAYYLTPSSNYNAASTATLQAAVDLYGFGSAQVAAVAQAWRAVGLGQAAPVVSSFAPSSGPAGTVVTITGSNLSTATAVTFNGVPATAGTLLSATQLQVVVPAGASTGPVVVTTPGGSGSSPGVFTVTGTGPAPTISSYAPAAGQRTGVAVVVTGTNLGGTTAVSIGGVAATFVVNSATQLTVTVPAAATGGPLAVVTPGGSASVGFTVLPYLSGFAPGSGPVGTAVTLTGTSLTGALSVKFNGVYAIFTGNTATSITATVPAGATTGPVTVRTAAGTANSLSNFTVTPSLAVSSFAPGSGAVATAVTIRGVGFTGATAVRFNGVAAVFTLASDTELWATVPAGASTGPISVVAPLGTAASSGSFVVLVPGAPVVSSFTPAYGAVGSAITISGSGFTGATAVRFNGVAATFTVSSDTQLLTTVPAGASTGPVSVSNVIGTGQSVNDFRVVMPPANDLCTAANLPVITCGSSVNGTTLGATRTGDPTGTCSTSLDAAGGVFYRFAGPGGSVTLYTCGGNTNYDSKLFVFSGTCGNYSCVTGDDDGCGTTASSVTFTSVSGTNYLVYVTGWDDSEGDFTLTATCATPPTPAPTLTALNPTSGPVGTLLTLNGANLTGTTAVTFAGAGNNVVTTGFAVDAAGRQITGVAVPAGAATGNVTVTTPGGTSNGVLFTVTVVYPDLTISIGSLGSPIPVPTGTYNSLTVTGNGAAQLMGSTVVNSSVVVNGTLLTSCQPLTGAADFTLAAGATLGICDPAGLSSAPGTGAVQTSGPRSFSPDASYLYNGTQVQSTGNALPAQVRNLTTTNPAPLTLTKPLRVAQVLTVAGSGNLTLNGQALTLLSDASGTALVVNSSTGVVAGGTATVQRYLTTNNLGNGYRHYSAPVRGSTVDDLTTSSFAPVVNPNYNNSPTPGSTTPFPTVYGYDQSRLASVNSSYAPFFRGFFSPASLTDALAVGQGYAVNLPGTEVVDFTGTLTTGDVPVALARTSGATAADGGWALVGNPYPAPLDWGRVQPTDRTNLDGAMYVFESSSQYGGSYRTNVNNMGTSDLIGSSQGFFVRVSQGQTNGSLTFRNAQRLTDFASQVPVRRGTDPRPQVQLQLRGNALTDDLFMYAEVGATAGFDSRYDATKLPNPSGLNLNAVAATGEALAIQGLPLLTAATVVPLTVGVPTAGTYTLTAPTLLNVPATTQVFLTDALTGQRLDLRTLPAAGYAFTLTSAQAATAITGRFFLNLVPAAAPLASAAATLAAGLGLYPNPAQTAATVWVPAVPGATSATLMLLDALGRTVRQQAVVLPAVGTAVSLNLTDLSAGIYTVRVQAGTASAVRRLTVE